MPKADPRTTERRARAADALRTRGISALLLAPGSDLTYLTGYRIFGSERITCLVLDADGRASLVVPELEAARARAIAPDLELVTWNETDDPYPRIAARAGRAGPLAVFDQMWAAFVLRLQAVLPGRPFISSSEVTRSLRMRKDPSEIAALRDVAAAADRAYGKIRDVEFGGRRERDIAEDLARFLREEGHEEVAFTIVAAGPDGASPHHKTGERLITAGDAIVLDFGGTRAGYCSDITRTVTVGAPTAEVIKVHDAVLRAQEAGYRAARSGATCESVDAAARAVIADAGYGPHFMHRLGHGIGLDGHEHPYLVSGNRETLERSMAFSIEPGIYLEGRFGVRIEDIAVLGADGIAEPLNTVDRSLAIVR